MEIILLYILILLLTGIFVGFSTGLLGVGGGFILVPVIYFILLRMGVEPTIAIRMAFGTSLAIIIPTAISSTHAHYRKNQVEVKAALYMGISGFIGAILGGYIATHVPGEYLRLLFAIVLLFAAFRMLLFKEPEEYGAKIENILFFLIVGFFTGMISGLAGVGGGIILIPVMVLILGFNMKEAGGTSSLVIVLTSLGGIFSYIINGLYVTGLPAYSLGYVNVLQFFIIVISSIPMAQVGAWASHKFSDKILRYFFIILLTYIALKMLGVYGWLGLPL